MRPADLAQRLRTWASAHPGVVVLEDLPQGVRLTEVATGKVLVLLAEPVHAIDSRSNTATGSEYLVLQRDSLPPLALADAGFVFALDPRSTGPLPPSAPRVSLSKPDGAPPDPHRRPGPLAPPRGPGAAHAASPARPHQVVFSGRSSYASRRAGRCGVNTCTSARS